MNEVQNLANGQENIAPTEAASLAQAIADAEKKGAGLEAFHNLNAARNSLTRKLTVLLGSPEKALEYSKYDDLFEKATTLMNPKTVHIRPLPDASRSKPLRARKQSKTRRTHNKRRSKQYR